MSLWCYSLDLSNYLLIGYFSCVQPCNCPPSTHSPGYYLSVCLSKGVPPPSYCLLRVVYKPCTLQLIITAALQHGQEKYFVNSLNWQQSVITFEQFCGKYIFKNFPPRVIMVLTTWPQQLSAYLIFLVLHVTTCQYVYPRECPSGYYLLRVVYNPCAFQLIITLQHCSTVKRTTSS